MIGKVCFVCSVLVVGMTGCSEPTRCVSPGTSSDARSAARMIRTSETRLAPVYGPLADHIAERFDLAAKEGVGIDIGSGPGRLIIALCSRTGLHWVNADINPCFFPYFFEQAEAAGFGDRVSAIRADACVLPFRDCYADVIVSRGSFQFWRDKGQAFREIYRVLKPGGAALIGRGFSPNLPIDTARTIRRGQRKGSFPSYDVQATKVELQQVMQSAGISDYRICIPESPKDRTVSYGIWVEFYKVR